MELINGATLWIFAILTLIILLAARELVKEIKR